MNRLTSINLSELREELPFVVDPCSLSFKLGIRTKSLWYFTIAASKGNEYSTFRIKDRKIQNPSNTMKWVQRQIKRMFLDPIEKPDHIFAYVKGRKPLDEALEHLNMPYIITMDIKSFFNATRRSFIRRYFNHILGYNYKVAELISQLTCFTHFLPVGAPTSSDIANLIAWERFDKPILEIMKFTKWKYSRYSDDIVISSPTATYSECEEIIKKVKKLINIAGYHIHLKGNKKPQIVPHTKYQRVLGITVNEVPNISLRDYRQLRAIIHNCFINGFDNEYKRVGKSSSEELIITIRGKLNYLKTINSNNNRFNSLNIKFMEALERHEKGDNFFQSITHP